MAHGYIIPALGNIKPKDLRAPQIQDLYNRLYQSGTGLPTVRKIHAVLTGVMNQAVKHEVILRNPVNLVEQLEKTDTEMAILSETQISQFLVIAKYHRLEAIFHLAITTGMRESELLGLKWKDLDWVKQIIKVERQYERPHGEGVRFTPPKTKHGNRSNCFVLTTNANKTSELMLVMPG